MWGPKRKQARRTFLAPSNLQFKKPELQIMDLYSFLLDVLIFTHGPFLFLVWRWANLSEKAASVRWSELRPMASTRTVQNRPPLWPSRCSKVGEEPWHETFLRITRTHLNWARFTQMTPQTKTWQTSSLRWSWWRWWTSTRTSSTCLESVHRMVSVSSSSSEAMLFLSWKPSWFTASSNCPKLWGKSNKWNGRHHVSACPQALCTCWWSMPPKEVWGSTCGPDDLQAWTTPSMWPKCPKSSSPSKTCCLVPIRWPEGWSTWPLKGWVLL